MLHVVTSTLPPVPSAILAGTGLPDGPNGITSVLLVGAIIDRPLNPRNGHIIPHLPENGVNSKVYTNPLNSSNILQNTP